LARLHSEMLTEADIESALAAPRQAEQRFAALRQALAAVEGEQARHALAALGLAGQAVAFVNVRQVLLQQPDSGLKHDAFRIMEAWQGQEVALRELSLVAPSDMRRLSSDGKAPANRYCRTLLVEMAQSLFTRVPPSAMTDKRRDLLHAALELDCFVAEGMASFLMYLIDPKQGLRKFAGALESQMPIVRWEAVALLVMIGTKPCVDLLKRAAPLTVRTSVGQSRGRLSECHETRDFAELL